MWWASTRPVPPRRANRSAPVAEAPGLRVAAPNDAQVRLQSGAYPPECSLRRTTRRPRTVTAQDCSRPPAAPSPITPSQAGARRSSLPPQDMLWWRQYSEKCHRCKGIGDWDGADRPDGQRAAVSAAAKHTMLRAVATVIAIIVHCDRDHTPGWAGWRRVLAMGRRDGRDQPGEEFRGVLIATVFHMERQGGRAPVQGFWVRGPQSARLSQR